MWLIKEIWRKVDKYSLLFKPHTWIVLLYQDCKCRDTIPNPYW